MLDPIERKVIEDGSREAWMVYADRLLEEGAPWGPVIAAACTGTPDHNAQKEAMQAIFGRAVDEAGSVGWQYGMLDTLVVDAHGWEHQEETAVPTVIRRALTHPAGRFLRVLDVGLPLPVHDIDWHFDDVIKAIAETGVHPRLEMLDLSRGADHMDQPSWRRVGDLSPIWTVLPRLGTLKVFGSAGSDGGVRLALGDIEAPNLNVLILESSGLDNQAVKDLCRAHLPKLEHLELWFGMEDYGNSCTLDDVAALVAHAGFPSLRRLDLDNSEWEADLVDVVANSRLLPKLEELSMSMGIFGEGPVQRILERAQDFAHLKRLYLDENVITDDQIEALRTVLPNVSVENQKEDDDGWVYVSCGE
ncbi:MAG: hypothetical protein AAGA48_19715 [Myxococcota bacterium]